MKVGKNIREYEMLGVDSDCNELGYSKISYLVIVGIIFVGLLFCVMCKDMKKQILPITIGFGGDTMLGRLVNEKISHTSYVYPWGNLLLLLHKNNLNIINLETTLTTSTDKVPKVFNFKADPDKVQTLIDGKIDLVCIANNHIGDFGISGLLETINVLDKAGIKYVGAGKNSNQARGPAIIQKHGITIGVIGFTDNEPSWEATEQKPGTNYIEVGNPRYEQRLLHDVKQLKKRVDCVVVTAQWGPNKRVRPTPTFVGLAHKLVDAGMDIFHGHSAHIFQGIEIYKNKLIMYDTGDFVDDYAVYPDLRNDRSFLFNVTVDRRGIKKIILIPTLIDTMQVNVATGLDAQQSFERMKQLSAEFGTDIVMHDGVITVAM